MKHQDDVCSELELEMQLKIPEAKLLIQALPMVPEISLHLIDPDYPQEHLTQEQAQFLMDKPPYWAFCWASGQVMARYLLDKPELVKEKTVIDFGCGSGVVAIAAAMAGAKRSIALDLDPSAILASQLNANLNNIHIELCDNITKLEHVSLNTTLLIADVFYDRENITLLKRFVSDYANVVIADSRVKPEELKGVCEQQRFKSCTVPDLAEASDFNNVTVYQSSQG